MNKPFSNNAAWCVQKTNKLFRPKPVFVPGCEHVN